MNRVRCISVLFSAVLGGFSALGQTQIIPVSAYAESAFNGRGPEKAVNGAGLTNGLHDNDAANMWMGNDGNGFAKWFLVDFGEIHPLGSVKIWNYNQNGYSNRGPGHIGIFVSADDGVSTTSPGFEAPGFTGDDVWTAVDLDVALAGSGQGKAGYAGEPPIEFDTVRARWVGIRIDSLLDNSAAYGGLSEIQFFEGSEAGVTLDAVTCPDVTSAVVRGHCSAGGVSVYVAYGTTNGGEDASAWDVVLPLGTPAGTDFTATLTGLEAGRVYHVVAASGNGEPSGWSIPKTFRTAVMSVTLPGQWWENALGTPQIVFSRPASVAGDALTIDFELGGTAVVGTDYSVPSQSATFPEGETEASVPLTVTNNSAAEADRTVVVTVADGPYAKGTGSTATMTIRDDESARHNVTWNGNGDGLLWSTGANWDTGETPTPADNVSIRVVPEPGVLLDTATAVNTLVVGAGGTAVLVIGDDFSTSGNFSLGQNSGNNGIVRQIGGTTTVGGDLNIGNANRNQSVYEVSGPESRLEVPGTILICRYNQGVEPSRLVVTNGATLACGTLRPSAEGAQSNKAAAHSVIEIVDGARADIDTFFFTVGGVARTVVSNATLAVRAMNSAANGVKTEWSGVDVQAGGVLTAREALNVCQYRGAYEYVAQWPGSAVSAPKITMAGNGQGGTGNAHDIHWRVHGGTLTLGGDLTVGNNGSASFLMDGGVTTVGGNILVDALRDVEGQEPYAPSEFRLAGDAVLRGAGQLCFSARQRGGRVALTLEGGETDGLVSRLTTKTLGAPADAAEIRAKVTASGLAPLRVEKDVELKYAFAVVPEATKDAPYGEFELLTWGTTASWPEGGLALDESADPGTWRLTADLAGKRVVLKRVRHGSVVLLQ